MSGPPYYGIQLEINFQQDEAYPQENDDEDSGGDYNKQVSNDSDCLSGVHVAAVL
jgi:hypothetical protein